MKIQSEKECKNVVELGGKKVESSEGRRDKAKKEEKE